MLVFAGGFVALFRLLHTKSVSGSESESKSGITLVLAWMGLGATIAAGSALAVLQAVDGIALKRAVDSWYAIPSHSSAATDGEKEGEKKTMAFRIAEGIRWIEIAANSLFRILQGSVGIIFGIAIVASATTLSRWIGALGIFAGVATIILGVNVAYVGFATVGSVEDTISTWTYLAWVVILGIFMWRKTMAKKMTTTR
jgi:hypothetical protein